MLPVTQTCGVCLRAPFFPLFVLRLFNFNEIDDEEMSCELVAAAVCGLSLFADLDLHTDTLFPHE